jgi:GNAT superfamily N-acetyltransferase
MLRAATRTDIPRLVEIRAAVRENRLADPSRVTLADYEWFIGNATIHVWDAGGQVQGLSAGDPRTGSIWALFVDPPYEHRGIGRALLCAACADIRSAGHAVATLSTETGSRAERFYVRNGWVAKGRDPRGEMVFEKDLYSRPGTSR